MPTQLRDATRTARKPHICDLCHAIIQRGEQYHVSTNIFDGRVYDWRTCEACQRDRVTGLVYDFWGCPDEGIGYDSACDWAAEVTSGAASNADEVTAAEAFIKRATDAAHGTAAGEGQ